jgi:hypothetical protein
VVRVYWPAVFIMAGDISAVGALLRSTIVAFLADGHQVLGVEEECHVALVVPPVVDNWAVWCRRLAYQ